MAPSKSFKDLIVWQKAHQFVMDVYKYSGKFPKEEVYGLTSQFCRAAISIVANIAEGFAKRTKLDKIRMMNIAQGSLEEFNKLSTEASKLLNTYIGLIERSK